MKTVLNIDAIKDGSIGLNKLSEDTQSQLEKINEIEGKQDKLISGNNIKTINGASILGEGDITISVNGEDYTEILDRVSENEKVTAHALNELRENLNGIVDSTVTDIKVTWDANSDMNDFKTPGVYDIYGERTRQDDNLPILNASPGHSIAAKLTVIASTLQPANNEICVTQFLQLSNRIGGDGTTYVRTYNENNNGMNGWSPWQKQMGIVETLINGYDVTVGQELFLQYYAKKIGDGLNGMIDNGMYSGIFVDTLNYTGHDDIYTVTDTPAYIETFVLIVINDYTLTGNSGSPRHITQLKYAIDAMTGQSTVKKRVGTGNNAISWGNWEDISGSKTVLWGESSNMNDYKTAGTYDIYGERTRQNDNLPILNASSGHSIAARLTVVDSSLRKTDGTSPTELCITQFLMLSNRQGGDGNLYIRTYNENNSPFADWWTPWQKLQGVKEGYIFTDSIQVNPDGGVQQIDGVTGLNNMIDNGVYSGIYTDDPTFQAPTFIDTFTLIVINNYAVASKDSRLKRTISQLKYAVDAITNQASVKQRTKTDGSDWTDWTEISGGSNEVDVTDAVKAYGLPTLVAQGFAQEGIVYKVECWASDIPQLDTANKIKSSISYGNLDDKTILKIQIHDSETVFIDCYIGGHTGEYYKYIIKGINTPYETVTRTSKMSKDGNTGTKPVIKTEENNITLEPNVYYRRIGETSNLNVTLGPVVDPDILNEYFLEFSVTENAQVTFPSDIRWANKEVPTFNEPDTIYQVSIVNNLGAYVKF